MKPQIKSGDWHIIVNDREDRFDSDMQIFESSGKLVHRRPCLAKGQEPNYRNVGGDTPPGVYKIGLLTITAQNEPKRIWNAYGKYFFDLESVSGAEEKWGRSGVGIHGGGTSAPDPLAPYQQLVPTLGCIRMYNADLEKILLPIYRDCQRSGGVIYVSVNQH